ncbi:hypothetical protein [Nostoc sp. ChiVER01]|uniref:hypothetical protein n=1 Tax=Nostoc sp. ChiVER01 TaxID=3075382 RepID=UPI002AD1E2A2|nr:hypothetical protein [Nostoc sp. ChiVER01]MDZ8224681.1 hypothetical protein [Nostoc sp. ChiVER01]
MALIQKSKMISLLKQYKRALAWFISGLVMAALLFLGTSNQQPATAFEQSQATAYTQPNGTATGLDFGATHLEPNFYQY